MNTSRVYIGEVFEKSENEEDRRIGYKSLYYDLKNDVYFLLDNSNCKYGINRNCVSYGSKYIRKGSLISYESFARKPILFGHSSYGTISYNCELQISKLIKERIIRLYSYQYTTDEIHEIHERGNLTIDEKVMEIMMIGLCYSGNAVNDMLSNCKKYQSCLECTYAMLYETEKTEFEPFIRNIKFNQESLLLVKK